MPNDRIAIVRSIATKHIAKALNVDTNTAYSIARRIVAFYYSVDREQTYTGRLIVRGIGPVEFSVKPTHADYIQMQYLQGKSELLPAVHLILASISDLDWLNIGLVGIPCD